MVYSSINAYLDFVLITCSKNRTALPWCKFVYEIKEFTRRVYLPGACKAAFHVKAGGDTCVLGSNVYSQT